MSWIQNTELHVKGESQGEEGNLRAGKQIKWGDDGGGSKEKRLMRGEEDIWAEQGEEQEGCNELDQMGNAIHKHIQGPQKKIVHPNIE